MRLPRLAVIALCCACCGCGAAAGAPRIPRALLEQARPIGRGTQFEPTVLGAPAGPCAPQLGARFLAHMEVFAANRVVILPAGIGTEPPRRLEAGQVTSARCYGALVTLDPTGVVLVRAGTRAAVSALFKSWGEALGPRRIGPFRSSAPVRAYVDGRPWHGSPGSVPLTPRSEIVLEIGPYVPPHRSFTFPPLAGAAR